MFASASPSSKAARVKRGRDFGRAGLLVGVEDVAAIAELGRGDAPSSGRAGRRRRCRWWNRARTIIRALRRPASVCSARQAASRPASASSPLARIAAASNAALTAPALPMASVPTGMPAGIWTIDSRLSMPFSALAFDRHAEHRQRGHRRRHARQMRRAAGAGDDHLQAAILGRMGIIVEPLRACDGPRRP